MSGRELLARAGVSPVPNSGIFPVNFTGVDNEGFPVTISEIDAGAESGHDPEHHIWIPLKKLHELVSN